MSNIEKAMALLIESFSKYAAKDGDSHSLTKGELKELLQTELGGLLGKANDKEAVDKIFNSLDTNKDNKVDFAEFNNMIGCLTVMCHEFFCKR
ncbi:ictacalcin-like [Centropristis striata]|uniref:ictacalcin-like n=1 Tax=Centropristis striata TaxID=184440 RepID=UPI0027DF1474|nr:ictacalcin-like [Centropristis striata]